MEIYLTSNLFTKNETSQAITLPEVARIFEEYFNVELGSKSRKRNVCYARGMYFSIARELGFPLVKISASINYGDHTSVMYWRDKIGEMYKSHFFVRKDYKNLINLIETKY